MFEENMYIKCIQPVDRYRPFEKGKTYKARIGYCGDLEVECENGIATSLYTTTIGDINIYINFDGAMFMTDKDIDSLEDIKKVKNERKPLLIIGCTKRDNVDRYLEKVLNVDSTDAVKYYPHPMHNMDDYTTEEKQELYDYYIEDIKRYVPFAVVPTTLEFMDVLLNSDIEFKIVEISEYIEIEIKETPLTKEELMEKRKDSNFNPRD